MRDLCRSINAIIQYEGEEYGLFNVASFNSTPGTLAETVEMMVESDILEQPPTDTTPNKNNSMLYDFSISTEKFERVFGYMFPDTAEFIIAQLYRQYSDGIPYESSRRDAVKEY